MDELKPCPFCGVNDGEDYHDVNCDYLAISCGGCGAEGRGFFIKDFGWSEAKLLAIEAWNTRHNG